VAKLSIALSSFIADFAKFYHQTRVNAENLQSVRYRIVTTFEEYQKSKKIILSLTDRPGDFLAPLSVKQIKNSIDIISNMHSVDVNSVNDLYYLTKDKIVEMKMTEDKIVAVSEQGQVSEYDLNEHIDPCNITSTRLCYFIGYMQAEKLLLQAYKEEQQYKILKDNITTLHILDKKTDREFLQKPTEILFSGEYRLYSKEDIAKIGYLCGQMSHLN
jgi:hypothetical protein